MANNYFKQRTPTAAAAAAALLESLTILAKLNAFIDAAEEGETSTGCGIRQTLLP